jgi:ferredoxin
VTGETLTPVEPSEAMQTFELGRINAGFLLFSALIASTLVFGRWFCGWACHVVALQDLARGCSASSACSSRGRCARGSGAGAVGGRVPHVRWPIGAALVRPAASCHRGGLGVAPRRPTTCGRRSPARSWRSLSLLVVGFLIVWWLGAKGFCTHGCPYGAFFAHRRPASRRCASRSPMPAMLRPLHERLHAATCACTRRSRKHGKIVDPGCMKCLDCVSVCPKEALYVGFARQTVRDQPAAHQAARRLHVARGDRAGGGRVRQRRVGRSAAPGSAKAVPLLLSVGLGTITAVFALLWWRLLRRPELTFQHTLLKQGGRWTRAGRWVFVAVSMWLAFTAHTFVGQRYKASVIAQVLAARGEATPAQLATALATAEATHAWQVVDDPIVAEMRGLLLRRVGRHAEAEAMLLAAHEAQGHLQIVEASLSLASYCMDPARRRYDLAEQLVRSVLANQPQHGAAQQMLDVLQQLRK